MPGRPRTRQSRQILESQESDPDFWPDLFGRFACGEKLKDLFEEYCVLEGVGLLYIEERPELAAAMEKAEHVWARVKQMERLDIADSADEKSVQIAKLRSDVRGILAESYHREKFGRAVKHEHSGAVVAVDAGLVGFAASLLAKKSTRVIDVSRAPDEQTSSLPAPVLAVESPHLITQSIAATPDAGLPRDPSTRPATALAATTEIARSPL